MGSLNHVTNDKYTIHYNEWANQNMISGGNGDKLFGPEQAITYEQVGLMMIHYANATGQTLPDSKQAATYLQWAKNAVNAKGKEALSSSRYVTRAEASVILRQFAISTVYDKFNDYEASTGTEQKLE